MLWVIGFALWVVAAAASLRLARIAVGGRGRVGRGVALAFAVAAAVLYFRPHETILGGQDPGSYLNTGVVYARESRLSYVDPLLSQIPPAARPEFLYGHGGYGVTKDGCVWVHDLKRATVGVHFQPAYPLMMGTVSRLGPDRLILYVAPLFALLTGLALAALATLVIPHRWSGGLAFLFYAASPLVIWHGRCPRPELLASFMALGGGALLVRAAIASPGRARLDIGLGSLCVALAPFFHVTAWMLAIPAGVALGVLTLRGQVGMVAGLAVLAAGAAGFVAQTVCVTDPYSITRFMRPVVEHPVAALTTAVLGLVLVARIGAGRRPRPRDAAPGGGWWASAWPWALAVALAAAYVACFRFAPPIDRRLPVSTPVYHYLYPSDLRVVVELVSWPITLLGLAGLLRMLIAARRGRIAGVVVVLAMAPATLLIGTMYDFFMTRYMLVAVLPLLALGLAALAARIPVDRAAGRVALAGVAALACAAGLHGRTHLVTLVEDRGLIRFLGQLAEPIRARSGILLCEYTRVGAPLEHYFGIPTLGLDSDRRRDYRPAWAAWRDVARVYSNRPAFFLTPFQQPLAQECSFQPVQVAGFSGRALQSERFRLPRRIRSTEIRLSLYEMRAPERVPAARVWSYAFDAGNMGLVEFANLRTESARVDGVLLEPGKPLALDPATGAVSGVVLLSMAGTKGDAAWEFRPVDDGGPDARRPIAGTSGRMLLTAALGPDRVLGLPSGVSADATVGVRARWTRSASRMLMPVGGDGGGRVLLFFTAPKVAAAGDTRVTLEPEGGAPVTRAVLRGAWQWECWPVAVTNEGPGWRWVTIRTEPAWKSGVRGFPEDLGILLGGVAVWPSTGGPGKEP